MSGGVRAGHAAVTGQERVTVTINSPWEPGLVPALLWGGTRLPEGSRSGSKRCCCWGQLPPTVAFAALSVAQSHCPQPGHGSLAVAGRVTPRHREP